ncbi:MAG TPA: hypothetical protein DEH78_05245, partial [Solibacterales bacterium]|nr:hypothetical protein [Bryobacterales bacterium]
MTIEINAVHEVRLLMETADTAICYLRGHETPKILIPGPAERNRMHETWRRLYWHPQLTMVGFLARLHCGDTPSLHLWPAAPPPEPWSYDLITPMDSDIDSAAALLRGVALGLFEPANGSWGASLRELRIMAEAVRDAEPLIHFVGCFMLAGHGQAWAAMVFRPEGRIGEPGALLGWLMASDQLFGDWQVLDRQDPRL